MLKLTLPRFGQSPTSFIDPARPAPLFAAAIRPATRLVFAEILGNPGLEGARRAGRVAAVAHAAGLPLMIDATFATPYLCRTIEYGLRTSSCTRRRNGWAGHGVAIGGALIDSGRFDWEKIGQVSRRLTEPYAGYHGHRLRRGIRTAGLRSWRGARRGLARILGAWPEPGACLPSAARRRDPPAAHGAAHGEHAGACSTSWARPRLSPGWTHPDRPDHPDHALAAARLLPHGAGSIVSFGIKGGARRRQAFSSTASSWCRISPMSATPKTLVIHPAQHDASATRCCCARRGPGSAEDMIRLSVGLEGCRGHHRRSGRRRCAPRRRRRSVRPAAE